MIQISNSDKRPREMNHCARWPISREALYVNSNVSVHGPYQTWRAHMNTFLASNFKNTHGTDLPCNTGANGTPIPHSPPRRTITTHKCKCSKVSYKPSQLRHAVLLHFIGLPLSILDHCQHDHRHSTNTVTHGTNCTESLWNISIPTTQPTAQSLLFGNVFVRTESFLVGWKKKFHTNWIKYIDSRWWYIVPSCCHCKIIHWQ